MNHPLPANQTTTQSASGRGERLFPSRWHRVYWLLTVLREAYAAAIAKSLGTKLDTLVDYGCGNMPYKSLFPVEKYIGADFPGNELADVLVNEDGTLPLPTSSVPIVLSSQVLEHVADVETYLSESWRVLEDNGLLFLSTHGTWRYHPDPCDFWRWTCDGLKRVVTNSGFEIISFTGVLGPEATALQLWQDSVAPRIPSLFRHWFYRYMQWRIGRADLRCKDSVRDSDACVYILVASKKSLPNGQSKEGGV